MSKNKIMRRLFVSVSVGAAAASVMLLTQEYRHKNAAEVTACVAFADYDAPEYVSELDAAVHDEELLKKALVAPWIDEEELSSAVKVTPFGRSAAEISLTGLARPEEAPIILITLMNEFSKTEYADHYRIISCCDAKKRPMLPADRLSVSVGLVLALIVFGVSSPKKEKPLKHEKHTDPVTENSTTAFMKSWELKNRKNLAAENIGNVDMNAPEGLGMSGHLEAAEKLRVSAEKCGVKIFAVASGNSAVFSSSKEMSSLFAAYMACALAEQGCRTVIIECDLANPSLGKIFGRYGKGGLAEITEQSCRITEAIVMNVRKGVDIIAEIKPSDDPHAVLSSPQFKNLVDFLSGQYDILLLTCPKAWDGDIWDMVLKCCGGTVTVLEDSLTPDSACEEGLKSSNGKINHICSVKTAHTDRKGS